MSNEPESNLDLVTPDAPLRTDGPTLAEFVAAGYAAENYPPQGYDVVTIPAPAEGVLSPAEYTLTIEPLLTVDTPQGPVDLHADSGYRPVGGAEISRYLNAKSMGLQGRPSKAEVDAFLLSKTAT